MAISEKQHCDTTFAKSELDTGGAVFVDVRDEASFADGHIPGATHLTETNWQDVTSTIDKTKPIIVNCYHGNRSQIAADSLCAQGFMTVYTIDGGFAAWSDANYPIETQS